MTRPLKGQQEYSREQRLGDMKESAALRELHNHIRTEESLYSMGKDLLKNFRILSNLICVDKIHSVFSGEGKV